MTELSKEYAEALYSLAAESGQTEGWLQALEQVTAAIAAEPAYGDLLACPSIPRKERDTLLSEAFGSLLPATALSFVQLLCAKGHSALLADSVAQFRTLYEDAIRRHTAYVVSAVPLSDDQQRRLQEKLETISGGTVQLSCTVDESLLGGVRVELDGKVLDGSLKNRLHDVKEVMIQ